MFSSVQQSKYLSNHSTQHVGAKIIQKFNLFIKQLCLIICVIGQNEVIQPDILGMASLAQIGLVLTSMVSASRTTVNQSELFRQGHNFSR